MKILLVCAGNSYQSTVIYADNLCKILIESNKIEKIDIIYNGRLIEGNSNGFLFKTKPALSRLKLSIVFVRSYLLLTRITKNYDIVHITSQRLGLLALNNKQFLITYHDVFPYTFNILKDKELVKLYNHGILIRLRHVLFLLTTRFNGFRKVFFISVSHYTESQVSFILRYSTELMTVIPFPILIYNSPNKIDIRKKYNIPNASIIVLFVGTDEPRKNSKLKYGIINSDLQNFYFINIGPLNKDSIAYSARGRLLSLTNIGKNELQDIYNIADIYISPSFDEGFDVPILEAFFSNTLVVCSDIPVHHEIMGENAIFFNQYDLEDLKDKLRAFSSIKSISLFKLKNHENKLLREYSPEVIREKFLQTYENISKSSKI